MAEKKIQDWDIYFSSGGIGERRGRRGYVKDGLLYCSNQFYADFEVEEIINLAHPGCKGAKLSEPQMGNQP